MFEGYHGIALHATQGNRASYRARGKSHGFSYFRQEPGVYLQEKAGRALQNSCLFRDVRTTA